MTSLFILGNSNVDSSQRINILAAAAPTYNELTPRSSLDAFVQSVQYETIASVLRQCEKPPTFQSNRTQSATRPSTQAATSSLPQEIHHINPDHTGSRSSINGPPRKFANPDLFMASKFASNFVRCGKFRHWWADHNEEVSFDISKPSFYKAQVAPHPANQAPSNFSNCDNKSVTFNVAAIDGYIPLSTAKTSPYNPLLGPMVDIGAPYSSIGFSKLFELSSSILPSWRGELEPVPTAFSKFQRWQNGIGEHSSESRRILGSVMIDAISGDGTILSVHHLVLDGPSQWFFGINFTYQKNPAA